MNEDNKSKSLGIIITLLFHLLLAVLLWLAHFGAFQKEEESGILVMVGVDAEGSGEELMSSDVTDLQPEPQPEEIPATPPPPPAPQPVPNPTPEPAPQMLTQEDVDAPAVAAQKEKELKEKQAEEARKKAEQQRLQQEEELRRQEEARQLAEAKRIQAEEEAKRKAAEEAARKKAEAEAAKRQAINNQIGGLFNNKGTGSNSGVQGAVNGNSTTGATSGSPGYGDFDLGGRGMVGSLPRPHFNINESGKVVVLITVDAAGNVKSATIGQGTTTSNQQLRSAAKEAALKARFKPISGNSLTPGRITYYFDSNN